MTKLLTGKEAAEAVLKKTEASLSLLKKLNIIPTLAILRVGERADDIYYENAANKKITSLGGRVKNISLPDKVTQQDFENALLSLNSAKEINGILVLRPLPKSLDENRLKTLISPQKDVEGLSFENTGRMFCALPCFAPITPLAVMELLEHHAVPISGKHILIIGRSLVVGKPLAVMLLSKNATVTVAHSKTENLAALASKADILITAMGKADFIDAKYIKEGAVVIDVGTNVSASGSLTGDCNFESVSSKAGAVTPVPGGVGAVTNAVLFSALLRACISQNEISL